MLNSIKQKIEKLRILREDPQTPKVQFVGRASVPLGVSFPQLAIFGPGGTVLGMLLGVGLSFFIEMTNDLVRTPRDVIRHLPIPLLGVIPHEDEDKQSEGIDLYDVTRKAPYSILAECYRRLRTNLSLSSEGVSCRTLVFSSGYPGDGKTSVISNVAVCFAIHGERVLLIDGNLRRPMLGNIFQAKDSEDKCGLSDLLQGKCSEEQAIVHTEIEGLDMIRAGEMPGHPAELLGGKQMSKFMKETCRSYDYVLIDSPPALLVSDAKMLASLAEETILVFNAETTHRGQAMRTIRELREVHSNIAGCVLFKAQSMKGGYFREQFRSYEKYQQEQPAGSPA
jgi:capsular exopolysaccharide synthesis family protein